MSQFTLLVTKIHSNLSFLRYKSTILIKLFETSLFSLMLIEIFMDKTFFSLNKKIFNFYNLQTLNIAKTDSRYNQMS